MPCLPLTGGLKISGGSNHVAERFAEHDCPECVDGALAAIIMAYDGIPIDEVTVEQSEFDHAAPVGRVCNRSQGNQACS